MKILISFIILLISFFQLFSQLNSSNLTKYDELEGSTIFDIQMDNYRNLWIATHGGLIKYDGYNYKRYHPDPIDSTTIADILVYNIEEDTKGYVWIGGMDRIYRYDPRSELFLTRSFQELTGFPDWSQPIISSIEEDEKGILYFGVSSAIGGTFQRGLLIYNIDSDPSLQEFNYSSGTELFNVYEIYKSRFGDFMWIIAANGIFVLDEDRKLSMEAILQAFGNQTKYINSFIEDSLGHLYFTMNDHSLHRYNSKTHVIKSWDILEQSNAPQGLGKFVLEFDHNTNLWIGTDVGLVRFDTDSESFTAFDDKNPLAGERIKAIHKDRFNNLWIGTQNEGLYKYKIEPKLSSFKADNNNKETITSGWSSRIYADEKDVWAFSDGDVNYSGVNKLEPSTGKIESKSYTEIFNSNLFGQGKGQLDSTHFLLSYGDDLYTLDKNTWEVEPWDNVFGDSIFIFKTYVDRYNKTWFCTNAGLYSTDSYVSTPSKIQFNESVEGKEISRTIDNLYISRFDTYWAFSEFGLYKLNSFTKELERYGNDALQGNILPSQDINSLYQEDENTLWVGTWNGGLNKLDLATGNITSYTIENGLPSMSIQGILPDTFNNALWLSTFNGVSRFNLENEQFTNYDIGDGAHGMLFADGAYAMTENGYLAFGGSNGITYINPKELAEESQPPYTYLKRISTGENNYSINTKDSDRTLVFNYNENNLTIEYTGIHFEDPFNNEFSYMLEGYEENWRSVGNIKEAYYYNLPPGNYTFKLKSANSRGVWNKEELRLNFKINPPWWKTWWAYSGYFILLGIVTYLIYKTQKDKIIHRERNLAKEKELEQAREIEKAYTELKATQAQLIHSEKMASLGELTAGIAHEIQNPLNFVNNFSEVSTEMMTELHEELEKGDIKQAKEIGNDVLQNLEKIIHHGKRADSIVKGMLMHSRTTKGEKIPTDINALCDEFLRLSYHGLRAKDRSFNAEFEVNFDESIPKIEVVPQDIGRVLLNLFNNAFQACNENREKRIENQESREENQEWSGKRISESQRLSVSTSLSPKVTVRTRNLGDKIEISVIDNGPGIPDDIKDKIFQPFFTTKPTGQGTGLGLSLAYDIVKAHGGELAFESVNGNGTEFTICLPIQQSL